MRRKSESPHRPSGNRTCAPSFPCSTMRASRCPGRRRLPLAPTFWQQRAVKAPAWRPSPLMSRRQRLIRFSIPIDEGALDLFDSLGDGNAARAGFGAVEDRAAAPDAQAVAQNVQAFGGAAVAAVEDEAMRVDNRGRADPIRVGPDRRA